jgi:hypothetical protein
MLRSEKMKAEMVINTCPSTLTDVVEPTYTTGAVELLGTSPTVRRGRAVAFIRRKGNAYYLVHNVRRGGKVQQLHLARLGERARITDQIVREVSKKHPFVEFNWSALRDQLENEMNLADPKSPVVQKLVQTLRNLNLDLADLYPPVLNLSESPAVAQELLLQLRLLHATIQVKLDQFRQRGDLKRLNRMNGRYGNANPGLRDR